MEASYMHGNMKMTQKIYDTLPKYDLKPDARIQQRYMDHNKITEKNNKLLEEQRKKEEAKVKKEKRLAAAGATVVSSQISASISQSGVRASNNNPIRGGTVTDTTLTQHPLSSSIINDRDAKSNYRDAQYLNPDSRLYRQVKYQGGFRKRTFKTKEQSNVLFDEVKIKL
jgi:hypothetical protein